MEDFDTQALAPEESVGSDPYFTAHPSDLSLLDRMIAIFTSPREALEGIELVQGPAIWLVPLVLALLLTSFSAGIRYFTTPAAQDEHTARVTQFEKMGSNMKYSAEQRKAFLDNARNDTPDPAKAAKTGAIALFVAILFATIISALFFWLMARVVFRNGELSFSVVLAASGLTLLIGTVGDVLGVVIQSIFNNGGLSMSPAAFLNLPQTDPMFMLAYQFNIFKIWELAVFAIAFASFARKTSATGYAVVFGSWLFRVAVWTGLLFLFARMAG